MQAGLADGLARYVVEPLLIVRIGNCNPLERKLPIGRVVRNKLLKSLIEWFNENPAPTRVSFDQVVERVTAHTIVRANLNEEAILTAEEAIYDRTRRSAKSASRNVSARRSAQAIQRLGNQ